MSIKTHPVYQNWEPLKENFSSSHDVYQKWPTLRQELLKFSSGPMLKGKIVRTIILIKLIKTEVLINRTSHHV